MIELTDDKFHRTMTDELMSVVVFTGEPNEDDVAAHSVSGAVSGDIRLVVRTGQPKRKRRIIGLIPIRAILSIGG